MRCITRRSLILAGLGLAGCAAVDRSRLGHLYGGVSRPADQPPVVVIPGAFGSSLRDRRTGRELWSATNSRLLLGNYRELALPLDLVTLEPDASQAEAYAVLREGLGRDFYGSVIETLQRVGGYRRCGREGPPPNAASCSLYIYLYDFRLDTVRAARGLAALIERILDEHADRSLKVDIVAHSNGGLVARYFIRHGTEGWPTKGTLRPSHAGVQAVRRLLLVGTPNLGTLHDLATWRELGWSLFDPRVAARTIEENGGGVAGRVYLDRLREFLGRSLAEGRRFAESFATGPDLSDVPTRVFGGDCEATLARLVVESVAGELHARENPAAIAAPRTPAESLRIAHALFFCARHQQLNGNVMLQDNLLHALLSLDAA